MQQIKSVCGYCAMTGETQRPFTACKFVQKAYCESLRGVWENSHFCEQIKCKIFVLINYVTFLCNFSSVQRCGLGLPFYIMINTVFTYWISQAYNQNE